MGSLVFQAWDEEDLNGTPIGTLSDPYDKSVLIQLNGVGAAEFTLTRWADDRQDCRPGRYITVHLDSTGNDAIFGFFVTESRNVVLSQDEQGAEVMRRSGEGAMSVLADAIAWHESVTGNDAAEPSPEDDYWHWTAAMGAHPAGVMVRMLEEAQTRGCFSFLTYDFDRDEDSDGNAWTVDLEDFRIPIGTDLLTVAGMLQQLGLVFVMDPDFTLHCYESDNYGTDVSGSVTFEHAVNIAHAAEQHQIAAPARSTVLVKGKRGDNGQTAWVPADSAAGLAEVKRRKEGFHDAGETAGYATLQLIGLESIYQKLRLKAGPTGLGVYSTSLAPFDDYTVGDTVTVDVSGVWEAEAKQITWIGLTETDTGEYDVVVGFDTGPTYQSKGSTTGGGTKSVCGECPDGDVDRALGRTEKLYADATETNLLIGETLTAEGTVAPNSPHLANDDSLGTGFTYLATGVYSGGQAGYWVCDFGSAVEIHRAELYMGEATPNYDVWSSTNGTDWTKRVDHTTDWTQISGDLYGEDIAAVSARYWRLGKVFLGGYDGGNYILEWRLFGEAVGSELVWVDAPDMSDADDATYEQADLNDDDDAFARADLGTAYNVVRSRLLIGFSSSGSTSVSLWGANASDYSDEVEIEEKTFAATGSYTADEVNFLQTATPYRYFRLKTTDGDRRVYSWELRESGESELIVTDPTNGDAPAPIQDVLDNLSGVADDHIADTADAHDGSAISIVDAGGYYTGTTVEAALQEAGPALTGRWEVIVDGTAPPVAVTTEAEDDWLYALVT